MAFINARKSTKKSLNQQLLIWVLIPIFIVLTVSSIISYYRALYFANLAYDRSLFRAALALADQVDVIANQVSINLPQVAKDLINYDKDDVIYYRISAPDGTLVIGDQALLIPKHLPKAGKHFYYDETLYGEPVRIVAFSLPIEDSALTGNILVQVAETKTKRETMVTEIVEEMLLPQLLIVALAAGLIFIGIKRGLLPLQRVQQAINERSHLDLSELETQDTPEEIQPLMNAMNSLMKRVRETFTLRQQFIADASHQLRTPIAGLQTQAELALREQDPALVQQTLGFILSSAARLSHLLNRLLSMASLDHAIGKELLLTPTNLSLIATEITSAFIASAQQKNIDLGLEISAKSISILGDDLMLREMLANLIDNAIQYTAHDGIITVSLTQSDKTVQLCVADNGIGIPHLERTRVFERFHRLQDNEGDGCGLGLAIVHEIVQAHHATIQIEDGLVYHDNTGVGTKVRITFNAS